MRFKLHILTAIPFISLILVALVLGGPVWGANYPAKGITIIIPSEAGGGADREARGIAPFLSKQLKVRVDIENIPGANAKIGSAKFHRSKPDGYTIMVFTNPGEVIQPRLYEVEYKPEEWSPICAWIIDKTSLVVPGTKWKTLKEFVKEGQERVLLGAAPARGAPSHLNSMMLVKKLGIKVRWVPFQGAGEIMAALAGNHIDFVTTSIASAMPMIKAGKVKPIMIMAESRSKYLPDIPLAKELGYDVEWLPVYRASWAPPKTPAPIVKTLEQAFERAVKDPAYEAWAKNSSVEINFLNSSEFAKLIQRQTKIVEKDINDFRDEVKKEY